MTFSIRLMIAMIVALFPLTHLTSDSFGQERDAEAEIREETENEITIKINGREFRIDEEQIEELFEESGEEIEAWAEKHAEDWERWAEKFESGMEKWAAETEKRFEKWAQQYSRKWEKWGEQLEAGEIKGEELAQLMENNLEMLSEIPLGELIEGALENSLGELSDAPFESLDELGDIVSGALEQSMQALEQEIEIQEQGEVRNRNDRGTENLQIAVLKLQESIERKGYQLDQDANKKLARMKELLKRKKDLDKDEIIEIVAKLKTEMLESNKKKIARSEKELIRMQQALEKQALKEQARVAQMLELAKLNESKAAMIEKEVVREMKLREQRKRELAKLKAVESKAKAEKLRKAEMSNLEQIYKQLKSEKESLEVKESEIDKMRREIQELREELKRLKESKKE